MGFNAYVELQLHGLSFYVTANNTGAFGRIHERTYLINSLRWYASPSPILMTEGKLERKRTYKKVKLDLRLQQLPQDVQDEVLAETEKALKYMRSVRR